MLTWLICGSPGLWDQRWRVSRGGSLQLGTPGPGSMADRHGPHRGGKVWPSQSESSFQGSGE